MRDALADIKARLQNAEYRCEEHIRLSLVARLLQCLGWNIWNPKEVNTEFIVVPNEDKTRVDVALFLNQFAPAVFIEIKCVGQIQGRLTDIERQLRDYNRNNTAMFTVITDGCEWRFYYSQTGGEFARKCFETFDFKEDDLGDIEESLGSFLNKAELENDNARRKAENYLQLNQRQRIAEDCLPEARRRINEPPFPALPDALIQLVNERGSSFTREEALALIEQASRRPSVVASTRSENIPTQPYEQPIRGPRQIRQLRSESPGSLRHTKIIEGRFGGESIANWRDLIHCAIRMAVLKGVSFQTVRSIANVTEGNPNDGSFQQIERTNFWVQGMDADNAWRESLALAKKASVEIFVSFQWRDKEGAAFPGEEGSIQWSP